MSAQHPRTVPLSVDVLLVEDDETLCKLISQALRAHGLALDIAGDPTEARRLLSRNVYKVTLIDLVLRGGSSGFEVIDFIRSMHQPLMYSVVITAADPSSLEELDRSIVKTVFFKPLNIEHLAAYVQMLTK